ncbi:MAG TPA: hypothetical protein VJP80_03460 [Candidatus Saccharimonadales bacterium]|nr:hypothetical protein [Candidatus Saccharimonadales bacterium]
MRVLLASSLVFVLAVVLLPAKVARATSPTINFQARLMNNNGSIVADGNYNVEFKIYTASSGGTANWTEDWLVSNSSYIHVANGYLTASLGSNNAFSNATTAIPWGQPLWLTMNIGGTASSPSWDGEMSPRLSLTAVPAAMSLVGGSGSNTASLALATSFGQATQITLPDPGASSASVCYQGASACGFAPGTSGSYIQNAPVSQQTASFTIISASAGTSTAVIQGAASGTVPVLVVRGGSTPGSGEDIVSIQDSSGSNTFFKIDNAGAISLNQNTTVGSAKSLTVTSGTTSLTGAAAGSGTAVTVTSGATSNVGLVVQGVTSQTADLVDVKTASGGTTVLSVGSDGTAIFQGVQPASSSGNGTNPGVLGFGYTVTGAAGGNTTGTTGQSGGNGAAISLTAGAGGTAPSGSTNGSGGNLFLSGGAAGAGAGGAGFRGNVILQSSGGFVGIANAGPGNTLSVQSLSTADSSAQVAIGTGTSSNKGLIVQGVSGQTADLLQVQSNSGAAGVLFAVSSAGDLTTQNINLAANKSITLASGTGTFGQTYVTTSASSAQSLSVTNNNAGASSIAVNGQDITLVGHSTSGGTNTISAIKFENPTTIANNNFIGLNFAGTNYTSVLQVNGTPIINGSGVLQSAGLSGTYSNALTLSSASNVFTGSTYNSLMLTQASDGFTIAGGSTNSRTLTVTGGNISVGNIIQPTSAGSLTVQSNGANSLTLSGATGGVSVNTSASTSANTAGITIQSGSASTGSNLSAGTVTIDTGTQTGAGTAILNLGNTNAKTIQIGNNSSNPAVSIDSGTGALNIGTGAQSRTITLGYNTNASAVSETINIGTASNAGSTNAVTIGNSTATASTVAINGGTTATGTGAISLQAGTSGLVTLGTTNSNSVTIGNTSGTVTLQGPIVVSNPGTANTATYLCRNSSNQIATCSTTGNGAAFVQGGNAFNATAVLGTTDANNLQIITGSSSIVRATFDQTNNLYLGNGITAASPSNFAIIATGSSAAGTAGAQLTVQGGAGATTSTGSAGGNVQIQGGNGGGSGSNVGGNVTIDGGTGAAAANGTVLIGTSTASAVTLGRSGITTTSNGNLSLAAGQNITMQSGSGVFTQTFTTSAAASAHVLSFSNTNAGAGITVQGMSITPSNVAAGSGTNTMNVINFASGTLGVSNATTNGINFASATGYSNFINTPTAVLTSGGAFTGLTGVTLASGNVNATAGTIQTAGTDRISNGGNLVNIGTITTSGAINSQTISSTANFTGTVTIQGSSALTLGVTGTSTGAILFKGATAASGTLTLIGPANPSTNTLTLPNETGTFCTSATGSTTCSGNYILNTTSVQTNASIAIQSANDANITLLLKQRATQTADTMRITDNNNTIQFQYDTFGNLHQVGKSTFDNVVAIGTSNSSGEELRVQSASTTTIGLSVYAVANQTADVLNLGGNGNRALHYTGDGGLTLRADAGQAANLVQLQDSGNLTILSVDGVGDTLNVGATGSVAAATTVNIGSSTGATQTVRLGATSNGSAANGTTVLIQGGNGANAVNIQALASGTINMGTNNAANTIQIGSTTLSSGTQAISIGTNNTSGGTTNVTIGTGGTATGGTTALQAKGNITFATNGTTRGTFDTSNNLYLGLGVTNSAPTAFTVQATGSATAGTAGAQLTVQGGAGASATTGSVGGAIVVQGGNAGGSGNNAGGNATLQGGTATGTATGGTAIVQGGTASGTAGSAGGAVNITGGNGTSTGTGGVGGAILLTAGTAGGSGNNNGGNIIAMIGGNTGTGSSGTFQIQNAGGATQLTLDASNTTNGQNLAATNGGAETSGTFTTQWPAAGLGTGVTVSRDTNAGEFASGTAGVKVISTTAASSGADYVLPGGALSTSTTYLVSFDVMQASSGNTPSTFTDLDVRYNRASTTQDALCSTGSSTSTSTINLTTTTRTVAAGTWTKITCSFITSGTSGSAGANVAIIQTAAATTRTWYIDNLSIVQQNSSGTQDVGTLRVGGSNSQGLTLLTLDTYAGTPFSGTNSSLAGSMYFDTTQGKIQCYDGSNWGACGAAPNSIITLTPEYPGAVLHGTASGSDNNIGTLTSDFCGNGGGLSINTSLCASGEARNFYKWTSPQASSQSYTVYVTYKLPTTFKNFVNATTTATGRVDNTTNAGVAYSIYKSTGSSITSCSGSANIEGNGSGATNTWNPQAPTTDPSTCSFASGNYIIFAITVNSNSNANAYLENLNFTFSNQ